MAAARKHDRLPAALNAIALLVWLLAGAVPFLPFARDTSPWNAVTLRVPDDQGNWWHVLIGAPFFLAFPMIWLRVRAFFSTQDLTSIHRRFIWVAVGLSMCGTIAVQVPFLLHLAGTSAKQRLVVLALGFGTILASALFLLLRRRYLAPNRACLVGMNAAYLANAALCLVVYSEMKGKVSSRLGWLVTSVLVWPMTVELVWLLIRTFKTELSQDSPLASRPG